LKIVTELIADKQGRPVPNIGIKDMSDEDAQKILEIISQEKGTTTTTTVVKG
jgi:hypothetical protein